MKLFIKPLKAHLIGWCTAKPLSSTTPKRNIHLSFQQPTMTKHCYHHLDFQENFSFGAFGLWRFQVNLSNARKPVRLRRSSDSWRYLPFLPTNLPVVRVVLSGWGIFLNWIVEMNHSFRSNKLSGQINNLVKEDDCSERKHGIQHNVMWLVKVAQCTRDSCG